MAATGADAVPTNPLGGAPLRPDEVPVRSRVVLVCGIALAVGTILVVIVAMIVALAR